MIESGQEHTPPQGMTEPQFQHLSERIRDLIQQAATRTGDLGRDIFVHGSRARGTAAADADLDIGIRVASDRFEQLIQVRQSRTSPGTDRWKTLQMAIQQGRLHAGETGISGIRKEIEKMVNDELQLGFEKGVQITVIRADGPFDQGPFIPLK